MIDDRSPFHGKSNFAAVFENSRAAVAESGDFLVEEILVRRGEFQRVAKDFAAFV
jgi:hypothetical protein